ncbi:PAAR domain-containing protein [Vibrio sp. NH-UV-68]|uniref:PAAR domain-containing protein n=1 Tax=unclassified Vibrio TaxID=2614977 RepID=UPI0036F3964F
MYSVGIGTKTSTGGEVVEGNAGIQFNGLVASSIDHQATCKKCNGSGPIVPVGPRDANLPAGPAARIGDYVDCGCLPNSNVLVGSSSVSVDAAQASGEENPAFAPQGQQQQQSSQGLDADAPVFVPQWQQQQQSSQGLDADAPVFVPQWQQQQQSSQGLDADAPVFVPQWQQQQQSSQGLDVDAPVFVPQGQQPRIANGTPVDPQLLNQIINLSPIQQGQYQIIGQWHEGFEPWAHERGINNGMIAHFNVQAVNGRMLHVYYNAFCQLEVVGIGECPLGY